MGFSRAATDSRPEPPVIRFVCLFIGLLVAFQFVYYEFMVGSAPFRTYVATSGRAAAALLNAAGENVTVSGDRLTGSFAMSVKHGCDGLQAMAILVIAVLVFPGTTFKKLLGVLGGVGLLFLLNLLRIASLFWMGAHAQRWFQALHVHVWPAVILFCAVLLWVGWVRWAHPLPRPS